MATRRQRWSLLGLTALVVVTGAAGYGLGTRVQSPGDALNDAAAPGASVITAEVKEGRLTSGLTISGTVDWSRTVPIAPLAGDGAPPQIVTKMNAKAGSQIAAGEVLFEVADRPVFVLGGDVPLLRNLVPGDSGPDVERLQRGLASAGYPVVVDGRFGSSTMTALTSLYRDAGYSLPTVSGPVEGDATAAGGEGPKATSGAAQSEIVFVPGLPAQVLGMPPGLGQEVGEGALVAPGRPVVQADVEVSEAAALREGQSVTVRIESAGRELAGSVASIGSRKESDGGGLVVPVRFILDKRVAVGRVGSAAEVSVATHGDSLDGLLVPLAAIYNSGADGVHVKVDRDGTQSVVRVSVEETSNGVARVSLRGDGRLAPGDRVVVGIER